MGASSEQAGGAAAVAVAERAGLYYIHTHIQAEGRAETGRQAGRGVDIQLDSSKFDE